RRLGQGDLPGAPTPEQDVDAPAKRTHRALPQDPVPGSTRPRRATRATRGCLLAERCGRCHPPRGHPWPGCDDRPARRGSGDRARRLDRHRHAARSGACRIAVRAPHRSPGWTNAMKGLIVGLGSIGRRHARNWAALGLGPLAVCRQAGKTQPDALGVEAQEYASLAQALETEQPDIVLVTNPTSMHVQTACQAMRAGAHVLVEKPLSDSLAGVSELLQTAKTANKRVMVGYSLRFHPGLQRLKALTDEHAIGNVVSARADYGEYLPDWHPWEDYRDSYSGRRDLGGGPVLTLSHPLHALCWLLGAPRRVTALAAHASSLEIDTEDVADIALHFDAGQTASAHVDYLSRPPRRSIE